MNKRSIYIVALLILGFVLVSNKGKFKENPPGTLYLKDSIYIDKSPVLIRDYREFLMSVRYFYNQALHDSIQKMPKFGLSELDMFKLRELFQGDSLEYVKMLPRTMMTYENDIRRYDVDYHIKSAKFDLYPVVNLSVIQMKHYNRWRTDMVKLLYATKTKTEKQRRKYPWNFKYRMVKREEWEDALGLYFSDIKANKKEKIKNANRPDNVIKPYIFKRKRAFYYDTDNAAETLENEIVTFNFKWVKSVGVGDISYFKFDRPSDWIGFRSVCEILPEK